MTTNYTTYFQKILREQDGDNSYSKYPEVYSNQTEHQAKYLITQLQNNRAIQSEISIKYYQIVEDYWLVAERSRLMVMKEQVDVYSTVLEKRKKQKSYNITIEFWLKT